MTATSPASGFQIGLVNAATGATIALPAGVNTRDDELHPTLTPDGRYLVFMRTKLLPKLNGDIVPPEARTLFIADRETGTVATLSQTGAGPVFASARAAWGGGSGRSGTRSSRAASTPQRSGHVQPTASWRRPGRARHAGRRSGLVETVHADHGTVTETDRSSSSRSASQRPLPLLRGARRHLRRAAEPDGAVHDPATSPAAMSARSRPQPTNHGSASAPAGHPDVRS